MKQSGVLVTVKADHHAPNRSYSRYRLNLAILGTRYAPLIPMEYGSAALHSLSE